MTSETKQEPERAEPGKTGPEQPRVEVETTELPGGQVQLDVTVAAEHVGRVRDTVMREFGRRANIPGFRKGKAPRSVLERFVDQEALKQQIIEELVGDAYEAAVQRAGVDALNRPTIEEAELTKEGMLTFRATVTRRPKIELGEYKGLKVTRRVTPVTDAQVAAELERLRSRRARFGELSADDSIEKGDLVVVDYEMLVEGEKREDLGAMGYPLEVGADQLFPEMNDALPGAKVGETREFQVSYPETHSDESLRGKVATFRVTVREARRRQLPELDDEFAKQVSDLPTIEELRERVRGNLEEIGKAMADEDVRSQLVRLVSEGARLDVPEVLVGREVDARIEEIEAELERRRLTLNSHLRNLGQSFEDWRADLEAEARATARRALVLDEIGEREGITVTEEDIHQEMHRRAEIEGIPEREVHQRYEDPAMLNRLATRVYQRKVVQFLLDNAEVSEEVVEPEEEANSRPSGDER